MLANINHRIVYHRTRSKTPAVYPIEVNSFTISASDVPVDKSAMAGHCANGCPSYGKNGGCPPFSPDISLLLQEYGLATVIYIKLQAEHYPVRTIKGKSRASWKYTEAFLPVFMRRQVLELARNLNGFPITAGHCTGCRSCSFKQGGLACIKPAARVYSLGGCGVKVEELMANYSDSPLEWWDSTDPDYVPPYQLRVGMVLHKKDH